MLYPLFFLRVNQILICVGFDERKNDREKEHMKNY